ncbi:MAG TPA: M23 family metallopeptidase [Acidobacteriota bacterium]|nr:M23 family metallopeptidase [Acidobacteriota bacterium]
MQPNLVTFRVPLGYSSAPANRYSKTFARVGLLLAAFGLPVTMGDAAGSEPILRVVHHARSLQPGEVVLLSVETSEPLRGVEGTAFGRKYLFYSGLKPVVWQGLIGVDLDVRPGRYPVRIQGMLGDGTTVNATHLLEIRGKRFPTRRLQVDEKFVTPPKELEERIRRESKRVGEIFAAMTPQKMWDGAFAAPVPGQVDSNFGKRSILNGKARSPHTGVDFTADAGTPIRAPNAGRIILAADLYFSGNTVIIDHGLGLYSFFAHLSSFSVREGDRVKTGTVVGRVGSTGRATGPHLHWTVRLAETRVDPLSLMAVLR